MIDRSISFLYSFAVLMPTGSFVLAAFTQTGFVFGQNASAQGRPSVANQIVEYLTDLGSPEPKLQSEVSIRVPEPKLTVSEDGSVQRWLYTPVSDSKTFSEILTDNQLVYPGQLLDGNRFLQPVNGGSRIAPLPGVSDVFVPLDYAVTGLVDGEHTYRNVTPGSLKEFQDRVLNHAKTQRNVPIQAQIDFEWASSDEQAYLKLSSKAGYGGFSGSLDFSDQKQTQETHLMVLFRQNYFNIAIDKLRFPTDWFKEDGEIPASALRQVKSTWKSPPLYVSSVTYGRAALLVFSSKASSRELLTAVSAAYKVATGNAELNLTDEVKETFESTTCKVIIWGGPPDFADRFDGLSDPTECLKQAAPFFLPDKSPVHAQAIGFTANYLCSLQPVVVRSAAAGIYSSRERVKSWDYCVSPKLLLLNDDGGVLFHEWGDWVVGAAQLEGEGESVNPNRSKVWESGLQSVEDNKDHLPSNMDWLNGFPNATQAEHAINAKRSDPIGEFATRARYDYSKFGDWSFVTQTPNPRLVLLSGEMDGQVNLSANHFCLAPANQDNKNYFDGRFSRRCSWLIIPNLDLVDIFKTGIDGAWSGTPNRAKEKLFISEGTHGNGLIYTVKVRVPELPTIPSYPSGHSKDEITAPNVP